MWLEQAVQFDMGIDPHLYAANGWHPTEAEAALHGHCFIRKVLVELNYDHGQATYAWVVEQDGWSTPERLAPALNGAPIIFELPGDDPEDWKRRTQFSSREEALALLDAYLAQGVNPYVWARETAGD